MRLLLVLCTVLLPAVPAAAQPGAAAMAGLDLIGTWHVLVHYKDASASHPEREHWDDRIWKFEMNGSRLEWVESPIVVFADKKGRFEKADDGRQSRVLAFWQPNEAQLAEIRAGLEIHSRGARTKSLRRDDAGWTSARRPGYQSAGVITYSETWTIQDPEGLPAFTFHDVMGAAITESLEGRTRYRATRVSEDGRVIEGRYDRDGIRTGSFRLTRAGTTSVAKGSGLAPEAFAEEGNGFEEIQDMIRSAQIQ